MNISINSISKKYNKTEILKNFSLDIASSKIFALLGKNGAGKSTIINILAGLIPPTSGEISINQEKYTPDNLKIKRKMGFMLQNSALVEEFTGYEYLKFVSLLHELDKTNINTQIKDLFMFFFDDQKDLNKRISAYSAGMKKKLELCACVLHKPDIIILDEPFANLDPFSANKMTDFLKFYAEKRVVFLASHDLLYVEKFATNIGVLHEGNLVFNGSINDFTENGEKVLETSLFEFLKPEKADFSKIEWIK